MESVKYVNKFRMDIILILASVRSRIIIYLINIREKHYILLSRID